MRIPIVDENDNLIYYKEKHELLFTEINRDTGLFIVDENKKILLAKRSSNKKIYPNLWSVAVAGTVEEGETYESNIIKEAKEELGIYDIKPIFLFKYLKENEHKRMSGIFKVNIKNEYKFTVEPMEISEIRWFSREELEKLFIENRDMFTPNFTNYYKKFIEYENQN
jgi:isopentenyldiphosphate isomerase